MMEEKDENLIKINNPYNFGKGNAIKKGVLNTKGMIVLITDTDLSVSIDQFNTLYNKHLEGYDIVIGSRFLDDAEKKIPKYRKLGIKIITNVTNSTLKD